MLNEEIDKAIWRKLEAMEESIKYEIESMCETLASIHELGRLYYWKEKENEKQEQK